MAELPWISDKSLRPLLRKLEKSASLTDRHQDWPKNQLEWIRESGVLSWEIPVEYSRQQTEPLQMAKFYLDCSRACLVSAFVLSQRNAAVSRLIATENQALKQELLPALSQGEFWTTVGISHLSTSRQYLKRPAVIATKQPGGYLLSGTVPWVTGAKQARWLVTGGTLDDGRQILVAADCQRLKLQAGPPAEMLALNASSTANIELNEIFLPENCLISGPREQVMQSGGGGTGSLTTSILALGVAARAVDGLLKEAELRQSLFAESALLQQEWEELVEFLLQAELNPESQPAGTAQLVRTKANSLVLRAAQAYLTASKGAGFVSGHPAERTVREAMFFLVWSCPQPVAEAALKEFACTSSWQ